jgi:hypothetical protein
MSVNSIGPAAVYQVPITAQAKADDERTESGATKATEAATGKESPAPTKSAHAVDLHA